MSRPTTVAISAAVSGLLLVSFVSTLSAHAEPAAPKAASRVPITAKSLKISKDANFRPAVTKTADNKRQKVFVELSGRGAADTVTHARAVGASQRVATAAAKSRRAQVSAQANTVVAAARRADPSARKIFQIANTVPGVAIMANRAAIEAVAARSDVVKVTPLTSHTTNNAAAAQLTRALNTWKDTGLTGKGVSVGVIDTGVDYTHADFGGPGTVDAYKAAHATADSGDDWTPTAKVVGGYDFAGDSYDGGTQPIPHPDPNPLDCGGHGTHVAGTAAGYGVNGDGTTYTGHYSTLSKAKLNAMKIGPGMAPEASIYALRVFGCEGSTDLVLAALDWALDPDGDADFSDHLDIVNLSLGADYTTPDDPENSVIDNLALHGVLSVIASGNAGDITDVGGSPGNAIRSLTAANSIDAYSLLDGLTVAAPAAVAGTVAGQMSVAYPWDTAPDVSGTVVTLSDSANRDGCAPLSTADTARVAGKVAWLEWDDDDLTRRCGSAARSANVVKAGAIGALFTTEVPEFFAGITGSATIPVFQLNLEATDKLRPSAEAGTLNVTFKGSLRASIKTFTPSAEDTLNLSSSRGVHGKPGVVKPDVAAPGTSIISAGVGTGNGAANFTGTSMASPHTAGIAALVQAKHPTWTTQQLKAAVMNTAIHDIYTGANRKGLRYGPARVGAGRVDAKYATSTNVLAYSKTTPGAVSVSFGVVEAPATDSTLTKSQLVTVRNKARSATRVKLSYDPVIKQPGVSYSVSPSSITLAGRSAKLVKVKMTIHTKQLRRTIDPTMSATSVSDLTGPGGRQFVADASGHLLVKPTGRGALRVPVYGAAKPASETVATPTTDGQGGLGIKLTGRGVNQGTDETAFISKVSVLTLGHTSRKLPTCVALQTSNCVANSTARSSDLRYLGAGAVVPDGDADKSVAWFGFSTWGRWATLSAGWEADVLIDTNGDDDWDYVVAAFTPAGSDQPIALLVNAKGDLVSALPFNFLDGSVDTNAYDSDAGLIPFYPSDIGLADGDSTFPIRYSVQMFNNYGDPTEDGFVDESPWVDFDIVKPGISTDAPLYYDGSNQIIPYTTPSPVVISGDSTAKTGDADAKAVPSVDALVIHLQGRTGHRGEVVSVPR